MNCGLSTCGFYGSLELDVICKARTQYYVCCVDLILCVFCDVSTEMGAMAASLNIMCVLCCDDFHVFWLNSSFLFCLG
jgi:hypothetical protein